MHNGKASRPATVSLRSYAKPLQYITQNIIGMLGLYSLIEKYPLDCITMAALSCILDSWARRRRAWGREGLIQYPT